MTHSTTNTYTLKREILTFSNKIFRKLSKPERKFPADMTYGMLASKAKGIRGILAFARESTRFWFRAKRPAYRQLCLRLLI